MIGCVGFKYGHDQVGVANKYLECVLFKLNLSDADSEPSVIYDEGGCIVIRSPRSNSKGEMVFLQSNVQGPHHSVFDLVRFSQ